MTNIKNVIYFIGVGLTIGFTLVVYAHSNFATKETVRRIEQSQKEKDNIIIKRLDRMELKLDKLLTK